MSVKLHCAYDQRDNLRYIGDRLKKNLKYFCPHCKEEVSIKKGTIREHHFSHKPNSTCSATAETILHFEAKHYLAEQIANLDGEEVIFPFNLGKHIPALNVLNKKAGTNVNSNISLYEIIHFFRIYNSTVEAIIPESNYIADIIAYSASGTSYFVVEIFVSHESDKEKIDHLFKKSIPYLELIPFFDDSGKIQFTVHGYYLPGFFDTYKGKVDNAFLEQLYPLYENSLLEMAKQRIDDEEILKLKLLAVQSLKKDAEQESLYSEVITALDEYSKTTNVQNEMTIVDRTEILEEIIIKYNGNSPFLVGKTSRSSLVIRKETHMFKKIIDQLLTQINISVLIGKTMGKDEQKEGIIGFELGIPQPSQLNKVIEKALEFKLDDYEMRFNKKLMSRK
jgi:uncharacterized protein YlaI